MADRLNVRGILGRYGLDPKSCWSQNFLVDMEVLRVIVRAAGPARGATAIELGAGLGTLSALLARSWPRVVAVERDRDLAALLRREFAGHPAVEVLEANAATLDLEALAARLGGRPVVIGNLPYHMASRILFHLLSTPRLFARWVLMFQKEMADRLLSGPGSRTYGAPSILVQQHTDIEQVLEVGPRAFYPAPKVRSQLLRFTPLPAPRVKVADQEMFVRVVRGAFNQRRKMLVNSLQAVFGSSLGREGVQQALGLANIDGHSRAEQLDAAEFGRLADAFTALASVPPQ